jgi:hypothetical protein
LVGLQVLQETLRVSMFRILLFLNNSITPRIETGAPKAAVGTLKFHRFFVVSIKKYQNLKYSR